jgi:protein TonB
VHVPVSIPEGVQLQSALRHFSPPTSGSGSGGGIGRGGGIGPGTGGGFGGGAFKIGPPAAAGKLPVPTPKLDASLHGLLHTDGSVHVQVLLRDASEATLEELRKSGLVITREPARDLLVQGTIAAGKLADLARLSSVRYVVRLSR